MAKILGISGSPRNKSTEYALGEALKSIESRDGIETSMITLRGEKDCALQRVRILQEKIRHGAV